MLHDFLSLFFYLINKSSIVNIGENGKNIKIIVIGVTEKEIANAQDTLECLTHKIYQFS